MNDRGLISRRAFAAGALALGLGPKLALAQGFAGLGINGEGFAAVSPGKTFTFPADHGSHPDYGSNGVRDGKPRRPRWCSVRRAVDLVSTSDGAGPARRRLGEPANLDGTCRGHHGETHRYSETFRRGGVGEAGVEAALFHAWIDAWDMRGLDAMSAANIAPLELTASGADFSYALRLDADRPLVLQGDGGYSRKSERGQASYYYSQPFFKVAGSITLADKPIEVSGEAWMDREWSSQPLASDQNGWDWFSLHLETGEKLMLFGCARATDMTTAPATGFRPTARPRKFHPPRSQ